MKRSAVPFVIALVACALAGVLALRVFSSNKNDSGSQVEEPAKTDAPVEETKEEEPAPVEGTWVISKEIQTYRTTDEDSDVMTTYELDNHGNTAKVTQESGQSETPYVVTYEYDEDGYVTSSQDNWEGSEPLTFTLEKDDQGRLTKSTSSGGSAEELTYDEAGNVVQRVITGNTMGEDMDGNWVVNGTYTATIKYDADGFITSSSYEGNGFYQLIEKTYERNDAGQVISVTNSDRSSYDQASLEDATATVSTATFEYDDAGNIVRVTEEGDAFSYVTVYEYELIEHPSKAIEITSHLKNV